MRPAPCEPETATLTQAVMRHPPDSKGARIGQAGSIGRERPSPRPTRPAVMARQQVAGSRQPGSFYGHAFKLPERPNDTTQRQPSGITARTIAR
jgi:hypothetical protein